MATYADIHRLNDKLVEVLGPEPAATLMELLVGPYWSTFPPSEHPVPRGGPLGPGASLH